MAPLTLGIRAVRLAAASLSPRSCSKAYPAVAALAHHDFDDFDTARRNCIAGTVLEVRWSDLHSYFTVTLESDVPADTPELPLPEDLQAPDSGPINAAPPYSGSHEELRSPSPRRAIRAGGGLTALSSMVRGLVWVTTAAKHLLPRSHLGS
ncbi:DUF6152 family protein [Micrococcaceae bacterium Sec5.1]